MEQQTNQRPSFLTVLCILTFIGSGLGLLGGLLGLLGSSFLPDFLAPKGTMIVQIVALAGTASCLLGAAQMWSLKKQGFMMYVIGCGLGVVSGIISYVTIDSYLSDLGAGGEMASSVVQGAMITGIIIGAIISLVFILMYNANRKYLVN
jgi:hypothetical protein